MNYVGCDIGATKIEAGVIGSKGKILQKIRVPTPKTSKEMIASVRDLIGTLKMHRPRAIGIGVAGIVDFKGKMIISPNMRFLDGLDLKALLRFDVPVFVDNDANCAALGEYYFGPAKGTKNLVSLTLGTGIGGGIISEGVLLRGSRGSAGELGHLVVEVDGRRCSCGMKGCLEAYASGSAIEQQYKKALSAAEIARKKDAKKILSQASNALAAGLASIAHALDPEVIVIGGSISRIPGLVADAKKQAKTFSRKPRILKSELGTGCVGAASLAIYETR